ncbi:methyl-accepting chemotaxis protein [Leptospira sp. GIMC2001]|uniref:methyl-accepting chemotaxis protein n=1 Tax=Leptospira sp. GIMC2001 TaxID=1513297 RepID=UPI002348F261|nr:methyl-accepting chemotaxis protein [Leptospira sp. GIMC2001]WCL49927.1 methyl-accepting chemotaxis protein [Leptospira sp. GIMC2001]
MSFIRNLTISKRLYISLFVILIPIVFLLFLIIRNQYKTIVFSSQELHGLRINKSVWDLMINIQEGYLNKSSIAGLEEGVRAIKQDLIDSNIQLDNSEMIDLLETAQEISQLKQADSNPELLDHMQKLLIDLHSDLTDKSNLILDPDLDSYYLMDIGMLKLPNVVFYCGIYYHNIPKFSNPNSRAKNDLGSLRFLLSDCEKVMKEVEFSFHKEFQYNIILRESILEKEAVWISKFNEFYRLAKLFNNDPSQFGYGSKNFEELESSYIVFFDSHKEIHTRVLNDLERVLNLRINNLKMESAVSIFLSMIICIAAFLFQAYVNRTIARPLSVAVVKFDELAKGNIKQSFDYAYNDEIGSLYSSSQAFVLELNKILKEILLLVDRVSRYSEQTSIMAGMLSESSQNQAAQTEESSASIEEISASFDKVAKLIARESNDIQEIGFITENIAESIRYVNQQMAKLKIVADQLMSQAQLGEDTIGSTTDSMRYMQEVSGQIGGIVSIITDISEQTNLLSLNASIEAARAGDMGRGFAVVASEVSKLSEKTGESVSQIKKLIQTSDKTVDQGVHSVSSSVDVIRGILANISEIHKNSETVVDAVGKQSTNVDFIHRSYRELKSLSAEIDQSAKEEKIAIDQVTESLQLIAESTQVIADNAGALAEISGKLDSASHQLNSTIGWFHIK